MADENLTPRERELDAQGRELLEAIRQMREREARQRAWLRQQVEAAYEQRDEDERRQRDEGGSGP